MERIKEMRGGAGTFESVPDLYSGENAPMMDNPHPAPPTISGGD